MPQPLWERNLRTLTVNADRAGQPVVQAYRSDVAELIRELDHLRAQNEQFAAAAYTALDTRPLMTLVGR